MVMWLNDIASRYNFVSLKVIGKSVEGRPIHVVTINDHLVELPIILLEGGAHSREWIATASILYLIEKLAGLTGKGAFTNDVTRIWRFYDPLPPSVTHLCVWVG